MTVRFLIDLQCCQSGSRFGGIGRYSIELAKAMIRNSPEYEHLILLNDRNPEAELIVRRELRDLVPPHAFRICHLPPGSMYLFDNGKTTEAAEYVRSEFIKALKPDVLHVASLFEGLGDEIATFVDADWPFVKAITLYDLIPLKQAEQYLRDPRATK
ncbi:MAG: hypothetical protein RSB83_08540, partial [Brevundimonas sp.]